MERAIAKANEALKSRGIRMTIEQRRNGLVLRGTWADAFGDRRQQRLPLGVPATSAGVLEAESLAVRAASAIAKGEPPETVLASTQPARGKQKLKSTNVTCEEAVSAMEAEYWATRNRTSAAERSWARLATELNRLPPKATLTLDLLEATILRKTKPDSRTRKEAAMVYSRLARNVGLPGVESLQRLRGHYQPGERLLLSDTQIFGFLDTVRSTPWGWPLAAMATFGVRPSEIPSLVLQDDGTAQVLTVKRHNRPPELRTCFALPSDWITRFRLDQIQIPHEARWTRPEEYDSAEARRWVERWYRAMKSKSAQEALGAVSASELDLYGLRHAWARRSIETGLSMTLCAKAMGHSVQVHEKAYHRWISQGDLRTAMASLTQAQGAL